MRKIIAASLLVVLFSISAPAGEIPGICAGPAPCKAAITPDSVPIIPVWVVIMLLTLRP